MQLQTSKITVPSSAATLREKLTVVENYKTLMPDNIAKFEVLTPELFAFALSGMPEIKLKLKENSANKVVLGAASDKMPFELTAILNETSENSTEVQMTFQGDFNPMMAMMIKGPISKLMDTLVGNMHKL
ncbi:MAG: SRPBCC family protein [Flavobacterium sp.]